MVSKALSDKVRDDVVRLVLSDWSESDSTNIATSRANRNSLESKHICHRDANIEFYEGPDVYVVDNDI